MEIAGAAAFGVSLSAARVHGLKGVSAITDDQRFTALRAADLEWRSRSRQPRRR